MMTDLVHCLVAISLGAQRLQLDPLEIKCARQLPTVKLERTDLFWRDIEQAAHHGV
jgi:hypothetical protein